jgi:hypothetical protein
MNIRPLCILCGEAYDSDYDYGACPGCRPRSEQHCVDSWAWEMIRKLAERTCLLEARIILLEHPAPEDCTVEECETCSIKNCPENNPLHFHHDGCPSCTFGV